MMPTTPNGTRTWRSCSPLASVEPRSTSPDRVRQPGDLAQSLRPCPEPRVVEPQPVEQVLGACRRTRRRDVGGVGLEDLRRVGHERVGHRLQCSTTLISFVTPATPVSPATSSKALSLWYWCPTSPVSVTQPSLTLTSR